MNILDPEPIDIETLDRVCRGVASVQEGEKLRAAVTHLATVARGLAIDARTTDRYRQARPAFTVRVTVDEVLRVTRFVSNAAVDEILTHLENRPRPRCICPPKGTAINCPRCNPQ